MFFSRLPVCHSNIFEHQSLIPVKALCVWWLYFYPQPKHLLCVALIINFFPARHCLRDVPVLWSSDIPPRSVVDGLGRSRAAHLHIIYVLLSGLQIGYPARKHPKRSHDNSLGDPFFRNVVDKQKWSQSDSKPGHCGFTVTILDHWANRTPYWSYLKLPSVFVSAAVVSDC